MHTSLREEEEDWIRAETSNAQVARQRRFSSDDMRGKVGLKGTRILRCQTLVLVRKGIARVSSLHTCLCHSPAHVHKNTCDVTGALLGVVYPLRALPVANAVCLFIFLYRAAAEPRVPPGTGPRPAGGADAVHGAPGSESGAARPTPTLWLDAVIQPLQGHL